MTSKMSIIISTNGKVSFSDSKKVVSMKNNEISEPSRRRINRLVREGKAVMVLSTFNYTVVYNPNS